MTKYNDGTLIPDSTSSTWGTSAIGARTGYVAAGVSNYVGTFGYLYNWYAATDSKKICPIGWHVPTDAEWTTLTSYLNTVAPTGNVGGKMKSTTTTWNTPNVGADNTSDFTALPGGFRDDVGSFNSISYNAFFWSATEGGTSGFAWSRGLYGSSGNVYTNYSSESVGSSVRCLRD